jgi:hypothetical protein
MRSIILASLATAALADTATTSGSSNNVASQCVNTCSPILSVSSSCGLPVPSNYAVALNPNLWSTAGGWGSLLGGNWGTGTGTGTGTSTSTGWGNFPFGWFGFKTKNKRDAQWGGYGGYGGSGYSGSIPANGFGALNPTGFLSTSQVNCVCNSNAYNIQQVGNDCVTCLNSVSISNPCTSSNFYRTTTDLSW